MLALGIVLMFTGIIHLVNYLDLDRNNFTSFEGVGACLSAFQIIAGIVCMLVGLQ